MHIIFMLLSILISLPSKGQWNFDVVSDGNTLMTSSLLFPIDYSEFTCKFTFSVLNNGSFDDVTVDNGANCGNPHFVILDDYQYQLPAGFNFKFYQDQYVSLDPFNMGTCSTVSGSPINTQWPNILLSNKIFQFDENHSHKVFTRGGETFFQLKTTNGDVVCSEGTLYVADTIFDDGFE